MELTAEEREALSKVAQTLRDRFGATEVILYGSAARGQLDEESDIDLLVVLPRIGWETQKEISDVCFDAGLQCGRVISTLCYTTAEMEHSPLRSSPLVLTAQGRASPVTEDLRQLIAYRLGQAGETLDTARELTAAGHYRDAMNRAYYAMFYCAMALLASKGLGASKHSGVMSLFSRYFVKTGEFSVEDGHHLQQAFDLRQSGDYREFVQITLEQVQETLTKADVFLQHTRRALADLER